MKHKVSLALLLLAIGLGSSSPALADAKESHVYVRVKESKLRAQPQFWASSVADLSYGAELVALGPSANDKSWIKVKLGGTEGYVHTTALTSRKVILSANSGSVQRNVDQSSVVMAGKGFNRQVENSYASSKGVSYASVDEVEKLKVDPAEEQQFLQTGKLSLN